MIFLTMLGAAFIGTIAGEFVVYLVRKSRRTVYTEVAASFSGNVHDMLADFPPLSADDEYR